MSVWRCLKGVISRGVMFETLKNLMISPKRVAYGQISGRSDVQLRHHSPRPQPVKVKPETVPLEADGAA